MNGNYAVVVSYRERSASSLSATHGAESPRDEVLRHIVHDVFERGKLQSALCNPETISAESESPSSEACIDIEGVFPKQLTAPKESRNIFNVLQEWEGVVVSISKETFSARLVDVTHKGNVDEEADFPLDDLLDTDRARIREGAIFRWAIGYRRGPAGKERSSLVVFRDLPVWTKKDLEESRKKAAEWARDLRSE